MGWDDIGESACPIARSLAVLGDRWTMLIIRELFLGSRRFDAFQTQTGISPHLLSVRLKRLEEDGVIERRCYQQRPPRHEYRLTAKGKDLLGVVVALRAWGLRWGGLDPAAPATALKHTGCGGPVEAGPVCGTCGEPLHAHDITATLGEAFAAERDSRRARSGEDSPRRRRPRASDP
ncbi:MAG: helix-turn-helix domain-containing protein [Rhodospirillales bacterium]